MGLFTFIKDAGAKLLGGKSQPTAEELAKTVNSAGLDADKINIDVSGDKVKVSGQSMTQEERRNPQMIGGSRKKRIARGSGTTTADVNRLLNQFFEMQKMMKAMAAGKGPFGRGKMPKMPSGGGMPPGMFGR